MLQDLLYVLALLRDLCMPDAALGALGFTDYLMVTVTIAAIVVAAIWFIAALKKTDSDQIEAIKASVLKD